MTPAMITNDILNYVCQHRPTMIREHGAEALYEAARDIGDIVDSTGLAGADMEYLLKLMGIRLDHGVKMVSGTFTVANPEL